MLQPRNEDPNLDPNTNLQARNEDLKKHFAAATVDLEASRGETRQKQVEYDTLSLELAGMKAEMEALTTEHAGCVLSLEESVAKFEAMSAELAETQAALETLTAKHEALTAEHEQCASDAKAADVEALQA